MSRIHFVHIAACQKRSGGQACCQHETGSVRQGGTLVQRTWTCCWCEGKFVEEIKPLPKVGTPSIGSIAHGPFAPPTWLMNKPE